MNYLEWNKKLLNHYFNISKEYQEISNLYIDRRIINQLVNDENGFSDFINSICLLIRDQKNFFSTFHKLYIRSLPQEWDGKIIRKDEPEYFGFISFIVLALTEGDDKEFNIDNVYGRINSFGEKYLKERWVEIDSPINKKLLEPAWEYLEQWSVEYKKGKRGYFHLVDTNNRKRKYVARIARHALIHQGHLSKIIDILIDENITPGEELSSFKWIDLLERNKTRIKIPLSLFDILKEESPLQENILKIIKDYCRENYSDRTISSIEGKKRTPAIPLKLIIEKLPDWHKKIDNIYVRAFSNELSEDNINLFGSWHTLYFDKCGYSNKILCNDLLNNKIVISNQNVSKQRFIYNSGIKWLIKDHDLKEWVETSLPENAQVFLIFCPKHYQTLIDREKYKFRTYILPFDEYLILRFEQLETKDFIRLKLLLGLESVNKGNIRLTGLFVTDFRTTIFKEFPYGFIFSGEEAEPELYGKIVGEEEKYPLIKEIYQVDEESSALRWKLPSKFPIQKSFKVYEEKSKTICHLQYIVGILNQESSNIKPPCVKDNEGRYFRHQIDKDIFDIPQRFNKADFNITHFNSWQNKYWSTFRGKKDIYCPCPKPSVFSFENGLKGNLLLKFLTANPNVTTYDFPKLLQQLEPNTNIKNAKRILQNWRHLRYIDFEDYGKSIFVCQTSIMFLESDGGLKGFLTGYRNEEIIDILIKKCKKINLIVYTEKHNNSFGVYPTKIIIYDPYSDLARFKALASELNIKLNNIENPLNDCFANYQLSSFYYQNDIITYENSLSYQKKYDQDHNRKSVFNIETILWEETNLDVELINQPALIRYDGFEDNSKTYVLRINNDSILLSEFSLALFYLLHLYKINVLKIKEDSVSDRSDLFIPAHLPLPFWLERGLILCNANIPYLNQYNKVLYRVYPKVFNGAIDLIRQKTGQKISKII